MTTAARLDAVITYEPTAEQLTHVVDQLLSLRGHAMVLDNSESGPARERVRLACQSAGIPVVADGTNHGTAYGLNRALARAVDAGLPWLHYLDQDSVLLSGYVEALADLDTVDAHVGAVGARFESSPHETVSAFPPGGVALALSPATFLIASGTAFRTEALLDCDGFDEGMFLDVVDHEICLALRSRGWGLTVDSRRSMGHEIGSGGVTTVRNILVTRHPLWRRRQMWRNSVVLVGRYFRVAPRDCVAHLAVRVVETTSGSWRYRSVGYLSAAIRGIGDAIRSRGPRRGRSSHLQG